MTSLAISVSIDSGIADDYILQKALTTYVSNFDNNDGKIRLNKGLEAKARYALLGEINYIPFDFETQLLQRAIYLYHDTYPKENIDDRMNLSYLISRALRTDTKLWQ